MEASPVSALRSARGRARRARRGRHFDATRVSSLARRACRFPAPARAVDGGGHRVSPRGV